MYVASVLRRLVCFVASGLCVRANCASFAGWLFVFSVGVSWMHVRFFYSSIFLSASCLVGACRVRSAVWCAFGLLLREHELRFGALVFASACCFRFFAWFGLVRCMVCVRTQDIVSICLPSGFVVLSWSAVFVFLTLSRFFSCLRRRASVCACASG
jgi:hypothetical protein